MSVATIISCGSSDTEETKSPESIKTPSDTITTQQGQLSETPSKTQTITLPQGNIPGATNSSVKLNPPHGEPGHKCEIAVGAPLDGTSSTSTAAPNIVTPNVQTPNIQTITPTETKPILPANSSKKLNPPHGQPGHKCEIAVGAPLDGTSSIDNNTNTTNAQTLAIAPTQKNEPTIITTTPVPTIQNKIAATNIKLNPAHGEPGHQCGIAVGAPLDGSATTKTEIKPAGNNNPLQYFQPLPTVEPNKSAKVQPKEGIKN